MTGEEIQDKLEKLLRPMLVESKELNYGIAQNHKNKKLKDGIEFLYNGYYVRIEIYKK